MTKRWFFGGKSQNTIASISQLHSIRNKNWSNICLFTVCFFYLFVWRFEPQYQPNIAIKSKKIPFFFFLRKRSLGNKVLLWWFFNVDDVEYSNRTSFIHPPYTKPWKHKFYKKHFLHQLIITISLLFKVNCKLLF